MVDGRWGPNRMSRLFINLSDRPEIENAIFLDLKDVGVPTYDLMSWSAAIDSSFNIHHSSFDFLGLSLASRQLAREALMQAAFDHESQTHLARGPTEVDGEW